MDAQAATIVADEVSYIYLYNPSVIQAWSPDLTGHQVLLTGCGLDRRQHEQFFSYVAGALTGDLGVRFRSGNPATRRC